MDKVVASSELVIGQWVDSPKFLATLDAPIEVINDDVLASLNELDLMHQIDSAEGIWLDFIGTRLGLSRPSTSDPSQDDRFGFAGPAQSRGFDQAPFKGDSANDAIYPLPDELYKSFIKARAVLVLSDGTFQKFVKAVNIIDVGASVRDQRNMSIRIVTDRQDILQLADASGALPRNAGVRLIFAERGAFGFDAAGVPFDQGPYRR